jgi:hypothetical protein
MIALETDPAARKGEMHGQKLVRIGARELDTHTAQQRRPLCGAEPRISRLAMKQPGEPQFQGERQHFDADLKLSLRARRNAA